MSWHEAAAWTELAGKSLPTLHHWFRAADLGPFSDLLRYGNFGGKGPGERLLAHLFLPRNAKPPYQTVVSFPPSSATQLSSSEGLGSWEFGFLVRSGRAVLFPVYQGTYERRGPPAQGPNEMRELVIQRTKDVRRAVDYLESRPDVDASRLAFYGISMGANYGPVVGAVESRFRTLVLVSGGLGEGRTERVLKDPAAGGGRLNRVASGPAIPWRREVRSAPTVRVHGPDPRAFSVSSIGVGDPHPELPRGRPAFLR